MGGSQSMEFIMMMVVIPVMFISGAWVLRGLGQFILKRRALIAHAELTGKLLDRFGAAPELIQYLESDAGAKALAVPADGSAGPHARILGAVQTGIVLAALGVAFLALQGLEMIGGEGFAVIGALALALGLGFLASGAAAYFLSKSWGLINGGGPGSGDGSQD